MISIIPVEGLPEIAEGDDLAALIAAAVTLEDGDVVCVAHKVVSKAEGRVAQLDGVVPSERAYELAGQDGDPRRLELVLREAARILRARPPLVIAETRHGFVCASAGVDASNAPEADMVVLLPEDPDASAGAAARRARGAHRQVARRRRHGHVRARLAVRDRERRNRRGRDRGAPRPPRRA